MSFTIKHTVTSHYLADTSITNKRFQNGDSYAGMWKDQKPDGDGKYTWESGSWYEGSWQGGRQHGVGKHVWPSGAVYQGEWRAGFMHGVGTLTSPTPCSNEAGPPSYPNLAQHRSFAQPSRNQHLAYNTTVVSRYQGSWIGDKRHGLGKQLYAKGDIFEGLWKENLQDGPGRYMFTSGDEYDGEWRDGLMSGQGTFVWNGGERYDGNWKNGKPDGLGVLCLQDGTTYDGQWRAGKRHGVCVFSTPELPKHRGSMRRDSMLAMSSLPQSAIYQRLTSMQLPSLITPLLARDEHAEDGGGATRPKPGNNSSQAPAPLDPLHSLAPSKEQHIKAGSTSVRVYQYGNIIKEWQVSREDASSILSHLAASRPGSGISRLLRSKTKGISTGDSGPGENGSTLLGEAISKGHQAYTIMLALQLGMRYSVTRVTPEPGFRQLNDYDFQQKVKQFFPRGGSEMTAVHSGEEFLWKDYAPMAFRKLRELFEIDAGSYMLSLCSDTALRLLNSPGKSGAVFLLSSDDQYFVKTVKKNEADLLCSMLPRYYHHVNNHPHTMLTKFYGLHRITLKSGRKVHLVVMANLFNQMQLHQRFDIKGSRLGRSAGREAKQQAHAILKDLDLDVTFRLDEGWLDRLLYQLRADCGLLEQCRIMDYSLLLGVHYRNRGTEGKAVSNFSEVCPDEEYNHNFPRLCERVARSKLPEDARSALLDLLRTRLNRNQLRALQRPHHSLSTTDVLALEQGSSRVQLGVNMPAKVIPNVDASRAEDVILYFGIIDILQDYNTSKLIEHNLKSLLHDSYAVSVTDPRTYSQRFQSFLMSIFS